MMPVRRRIEVDGSGITVNMIQDVVVCQESFSIYSSFACEFFFNLLIFLGNRLKCIHAVIIQNIAVIFLITFFPASKRRL